MLVTPGGEDGDELTAVALEEETAAGQLAEIADLFHSDLPVACAYIKRMAVTVEGRPAPEAALAVMVVLDDAGNQEVVSCDVGRADDGRDILVPLEGVDSALLPGVFDGFVADALALARALRAGENVEDERWGLAEARDALRR